MILKNNFINNNNNISMTICPDITTGTLTTTIYCRKNGKYSTYEYINNFKTACKKFRALEKEIEKGF